jgi:hypothetical protein
MRPNPKVESRRVLEDGMKELIRGTVADPAVAELLVPDYPVFCKRTPIVDDYWPMFNRPNVSLVRPRGHDRATHSSPQTGQPHNVEASSIVGPALPRGGFPPLSCSVTLSSPTTQPSVQY